jgi:hypothetical protein
MKTAGRRPLAFQSLDEVMPEVDRLLENGYTAVGHWSLGQVCNHLAGGLTYAMEGFPDRMPWVLRKTLGPVIVRSMLKTGTIREGVKVPSRYLPAPALEDRAEAEALRGAIRLFSAHSAPLGPHPMVDHMSRPDWERFNCVHCAHHLSFLVPRAQAAAT